jgi:hypothetical protein
MRVRTLTHVTTTLTSVGLVAYVLGLVVTNVSLSLEGVLGLDLLHARYVLVGLAFLAFAGLPAVFTWETGQRFVVIAATGTTSTLVRFVVRAMFAVALGAGMLSAFWVTLTAVTRPTVLEAPAEALTIFTAAFLALLLGALVGACEGGARIVASGMKPPDETPIDTVRSNIVFAFALAVAVAAQLTYVYASGIFPRLPHHWGGGRPLIVDVWIGDGHDPLADLLGTPAVDGSSRICLVEDTTEALLVRPLDGDHCGVHTISLARGRVEAIRAASP